MSAPEDNFERREVVRLTIAVDKLTEATQALERRMAETYVRKDVYEADRKADAKAGEELELKVAAVRSIIDWTGKIIVGAVLLALLSLVIVNGGGTV